MEPIRLFSENADKKQATREIGVRQNKNLYDKIIGANNKLSFDNPGALFRYGKQIGNELDGVIFIFGSGNDPETKESGVALVRWETDPASEKKETSPEVNNLINGLRGLVFDDFSSAIDFISKELERIRAIKEYGKQEQDFREARSLEKEGTAVGIQETRNNLERITKDMKVGETGIPLPPENNDSRPEVDINRGIMARLRRFLTRK